MKKIHFVGIGGIGVSALAQYYLKENWKVFGSDLAQSEITENLKKLGAKIIIGKHKAKNLPQDANLVIYSPAVQKNNPELLAAKKLKIKCQSYPEALGELTKKYFTIAVSGTHGKSTTTAMIALILEKAGLDPTVVIGTKVKEFGSSNFRGGDSKYLVIEADEWGGSFLKYWPNIIVLISIEKEHLDYYRDLNHILRTFKKYISHLPQNGVLVANKDDKNILKLITQREKPKFKIRRYFLNQKEARKIKKILKIPGTHNISNALAALAVARILRIPDKITHKALSKYKGTWRRFEIFTLRFNNKPCVLISDYAHHPTEIRATLAAAREKFKRRKIWAIFQPHQHQRTYYLFNEFVSAFDLADEIILTNIYDVAGREARKISKRVSSKKLAAAIKKTGKEVNFIGNFRKIPVFLKRRIKSNDVILVMGAGDIYDLVNTFLNKNKTK
jgi:UDP-N-acetylmuramate--alanine ligase